MAIIVFGISPAKAQKFHFKGLEIYNPYFYNPAYVQAEKTVQEHEIMALNAKNSRIFFEALSAPIRFNRKLAAALEEHDQRVVSK